MSTTVSTISEVQLPSLSNQTATMHDMITDAASIQSWTFKTYAKIMMQLDDKSLPPVHTKTYADRYTAASLRSIVHMFSDLKHPASLDDDTLSLARTLLKRGDALKLADALQTVVQLQWADCPSFVLVAGDGTMTIDTAHMHTAWTHLKQTNEALAAMALTILTFVSADADSQLAQITDGVMGMLLLQCAADRPILARVHTSTSFSDAAAALSK
jgi:hypothetical protein